MVIKFKLYIESLSDITNDLDKYKNENFDGDLIKKVRLKERFVNLSWNDYKNHIIKDKIKSRSSIKSITYFNEIVTKSMNDLFDNHIDELLIKSKGRVKIGLELLYDKPLYLIIEYNNFDLRSTLNDSKPKNFKFKIKTILNRVDIKTIKKIIYLK